MRAVISLLILIIGCCVIEGQINIFLTGDVDVISCNSDSSPGSLTNDGDGDLSSDDTDLDIDEGLADNGGCFHLWTYKDGSYRCSCRSGFQLDNDDHSCIDIDECLIANGGCSHLCTNKDGSYECSCRSGFQLENDDHSCIVSMTQEPTLTLMPSGPLLKALDGAVYVSCKAEVEVLALITEMKWSGPNGQEIPNQDGSSLGLLGTGNSIVTLDNPASPGTLDLYVQRLQEKDVGTYMCTAVYAGNKELSSEVKVESYMDIVFSDTPSHQTPITGTDSKIFCTVTANPMPMIDWLKDKKPIRLGDRHIILQDGILIKQISEDDEGVYRCRAKVPQLGSIEYKDIKVEVYSPPEIIEAPENIIGVEKKAASFNCVASGKPNPTYSWVDKDSLPLEDAEGYNVDTETGSLTVLELGPQHTGTYRCTASNAAGDVTQEAHLQVLTKRQIESYLL